MSRILLAGVPATLAQSLIELMGQRHRITTLAGSMLDLATCQAAAETDVVVHGLPEDTTDVDLLQQATQGVWNLLTTTRATRYVLLSSIRVFDGYPNGWLITEDWAPHPTIDTRSLSPYLAEIASREITRIRPTRCVVLRLGEMGNLSGPETHNLGATSIVRAVEVPDEQFGPSRWLAFNVAPGRFPVSKAARDRLGVLVTTETPEDASAWTAPTWPPEPEPIEGLPYPRKIAILGAGGPLGAITSNILAPDHVLRLSDHRLLARIAAGQPQSAGAPLPESPVPPPHEEMTCDVTDPGQVARVVTGVDAVINCTVIREDPTQAFRVNTIGAWNVMRAAAAAGIGRIVHTGPALVLAPHPAGDTDGTAIRDDAPARPGDSLYLVSKYLGLEICRIYAERHRIACPALHYIGFIDPETAARDGQIPSSFSVSWQDAGRAMAAAASVDRLPEPLTFLHILCDAPHNRFRNEKAKAVLHWVPKDRLDQFWYHHPDRLH